MIWIVGHKLTNSIITEETNSYPLSNWRIRGDPNVVKISNKKAATSITCFEISAQAHDFLWNGHLYGQYI